MSISNLLEDDMNSIPLVDDDPSIIVDDNEKSHELQPIKNREQSIESMSSLATSETISSMNNDASPDEQEEKSRLISQVLELQNTLDDLSQRVDGVKEENLKLKSENQVLGQYIENLMAASTVFQATSPTNKKK